MKLQLQLVLRKDMNLQHTYIHFFEEEILVLRTLLLPKKKVLCYLEVRYLFEAVNSEQISNTYTK